MYQALVLVASLALLAIVHCQSPSLGPCPDVATQTTLDLERYLGVWYEIEAFPTPFERGKCIRAKYTMKPNGHFEVLNRNIENGKEVTATGDAYRPDDKEQGKLLVKFAEGAPYGKYWVVHTDYATFTLIYSCQSLAGLAHVDFAWILARNTTLDPATVTQLKAELTSFKVDVSKFKVSDQTDCPP